MNGHPASSVRIVDRPDAHRYEALLGDAVAGFLDYRRGRARFLVRHTEVDPEFEGRGIGGALAKRAIIDARAAGLTIIVSCPFVRGWLARHQEHAAGVIVRGA